jgi:hypothetical protein
VKLERRISEALQDIWQSDLDASIILARHRLRVVDMDEEPAQKPLISAMAAIAAIKEAVEETPPDLVRSDPRERPYEAWAAGRIRKLLEEIEEGLL